MSIVGEDGCEHRVLVAPINLVFNWRYIVESAHVIVRPILQIAEDQRALEPLFRPFHNPGFLLAAKLVVTPEKNTDVIREELLAVLGDQKNFEPFLDIPSPEQVPQYLGGEKPNWNAFFFYRHGFRYDENCARCPRTTEILESLSLVRIAEHAPEICFSVLTPGTHILPHHGSTNTRLVTHLPLVVPPDCAIKVGGELHAWEEGQCITFDDTFEHEAWNRSDQTRSVLILDIWNPYLTDIEKRAVTALIEAIRSFNRSSGVVTD